MDSKFREQRYNLTYSILRVFIHCLLVDIFHPELLSKDINAIEKLFQIAIAVFLLINFYNFTTILNAPRTFLDFYTIFIVQYFFLFFFIPYSLSIFFYSIILLYFDLPEESNRRIEFVNAFSRKDNASGEYVSPKET